MQEMQEMPVQSLGRDDPLEEEMATHSSILAWEIPWTEDPDRLQSVGLQRVGHDLAHMLAFRIKRASCSVFLFVSNAHNT